MTKEEAIGILNETQVVYFAPNGKKKVQEALDMAIEALSAEPIKVITDDTIEVRYTDFENIKRIILTNGDIFCKMFYEDARQDDDSDYDSLVPDEYKTETSECDVRHDIPQYCSWSKTYENMVQSITDGMREATEEERKSVNDYIESISHTVDSDLISRADAIEAVCMANCGGCRPNECNVDYVCESVNALYALPSANYITESPNDVVEKNDEVIERPITSGYIADDKEVPPYTTTSAVSAEPSVEIKECKPLCTEQKIAVEEFLNAPRITEECAIELLQMTGWLQEHDKEIGRPSGEWIFDTEIPIGDGRTSAGYRCSVCGADFFQISERANYCMVCGARMKGGAE